MEESLLDQLFAQPLKRPSIAKFDHPSVAVRKLFCFLEGFGSFGNSVLFRRVFPLAEYSLGVIPLRERIQEADSWPGTKAQGLPNKFPAEFRPNV